MREWLARFAGFLARRRRDRDLDDLADELRFHQDMLARDLQRRGMEPDEARRAARLRTGGTPQIAEAYADQRTMPRLETVGHDVRYALRTLGRNPGFAAAALVTLALGIGANTAIFSVVHAVLLEPLPYVDAARLVLIGDRDPGGRVGNIGYTTYEDIRTQSRSFEGLAVIRSWAPTLASRGEAERVPAMRVRWNFFSMLGVAPALGRDFREDEDAPDRWRVLILSDGLWRRRFGADPNVIGRTVRMNDREYTIVGVAPASFEPLLSAHYYQAAQMWAPLGYDVSQRDACRSCQHLRAVGRLAPGVSMEQAAADLRVVRTRLRAEHPADYADVEMGIVRLRDEIAGAARPALLVLLGAVGFVLLIVCANVANLLLARAIGRSRELSIRAALGAGRGRLVRQLLTESAVLALAGGLLGTGLAAVLVESIPLWAPAEIPRLDRLGLDRTVLAFALGLSMATGLAFGLVPAIRFASAARDLRLTADARGTVGFASERLRHVLLAANLATAVILLAGAGLMLQSVGRLGRVDPGFNPSGVLTLQFSLVGQAYAEDPAVRLFQDRLLDRVRAMPGVVAAALAGQIPMGGSHDSWGFHVDGRSSVNPSEDPSVERYSVTPDYFRIMEIPLLKGRLITDADRTEAQPVMLISEATADSIWPGEDPIGQRVRAPGITSPPRTIVGVVGDVRHYQLDTPATPQLYLPQQQVTDSFLVLTVKVKTVSPASLVPAIREAVRHLDPAVPIYQAASLEELVSRSYGARPFVLQLLSGFAGMAIVLAAVGLYGVVSYTVARRTREVGLRVALGATPRDVRRLVLGDGIRTMVAGAGAGVLGALVLTRFLESLLFDVRATDVATYAAAVGTLAIVTAIAHWIPIRRALGIDPAVALRHD